MGERASDYQEAGRLARSIGADVCVQRALASLAGPESLNHPKWSRDGGGELAAPKASGRLSKGCNYASGRKVRRGR